MTRPRRPLALRAGLTLPALLAAGALLAACGSDSPSNASAAERAREQKAETKLADFASCLREHGLDAEAGHGPFGQGIKIGPGKAGRSPAVMEAAQKACARYRPEPKQLNLSPQQKVELDEALQKFAKCMREHGIKVETNTAGGGIQIGIHHIGSGPNPESPGFKEAQSTCQKLLPRPPGARSGGPFATKSGESESGAAGN